MDLARLKLVCIFGISKQALKIFKMILLSDAYYREEGGWRQKDPLSLKSKSVTHPTMKKLGTVLIKKPYLK